MSDNHQPRFETQAKAKMKPLIEYIRTIPDVPKPGILFRDIMPLIQDGDAYRQAVDSLTEGIKPWGAIDKIAAPEARGFIFAGALAYQLGIGVVPLRKPGKLPFDTISIDYDLEYGSNTIEMHKDAVLPGERVVILDDLLATGGTVAACRKLLESIGANVVGAAFLIELVDLKGRDKLVDLPVFAPIVFEGE